MDDSHIGDHGHHEVITVITTVMTIMAVTVIIIESTFMMSTAGSSFGFFNVSVSIRCLYPLIDGGRHLAVQLVTKVLVSEPFGEGSDGLGIGDVVDRVSCL